MNFLPLITRPCVLFFCYYFFFSLFSESFGRVFLFIFFYFSSIVIFSLSFDLPHTRTHTQTHAHTHTLRRALFFFFFQVHIPLCPRVLGNCYWEREMRILCTARTVCILFVSECIFHVWLWTHLSLGHCSSGWSRCPLPLCLTAPEEDSFVTPNLHQSRV